MTPEPFTGANSLLKAPPDWNTERYGPCVDLPTLMGNGLVMSCWRPSQEEIALLVGGGVVLLTVVGENQPPVQIEVIHTRDANRGMAEA